MASGTARSARFRRAGGALGVAVSQRCRACSYLLAPGVGVVVREGAVPPVGAVARRSSGFLSRTWQSYHPNCTTFARSLRASASFSTKRELPTLSIPGSPESRIWSSGSRRQQTLQLGDALVPHALASATTGRAAAERRGSRTGGPCNHRAVDRDREHAGSRFEPRLHLHQLDNVFSISGMPHVDGSDSPVVRGGEPEWALEKDGIVADAQLYPSSRAAPRKLGRSASDVKPDPHGSLPPFLASPTVSLRPKARSSPWVASQASRRGQPDPCRATKIDAPRCCQASWFSWDVGVELACDVALLASDGFGLGPVPGGSGAAGSGGWEGRR